MTDTSAEDSVRLDVWLWATRLYRTRNQASEACKNNRVEINGQKGKPARQVRRGDRVQVSRGPLTQEVEVKRVLTRRVGAKLVSDYLIDHTPEEQYEQAAAIRRQNRISGPVREAGTGRPTKKDRRELDELMDESAIDLEAFEKFARAMAKKR